MRYILLLLVLVLSVCMTTCDNETIQNTADFQFETTDKEANKMELMVTVRYRIKSGLEKKLARKYGRRYGDSLLVPAISSVSKSVFADYSAGEIYSYKRDEVEQKISEQTKTSFAGNDLELTAFFIRSVRLSESLMSRFEKEYAERFENAINTCSHDIKATVTDIAILRDGSRTVFYKFTVEKKEYKGALGPDETAANASVGDTLVIEYACEDPVFHRLKQ
jgi:hypothetical protein